jgi:hypothetical protein
MSETLCTCTDQNCIAAHDVETAEKAAYKMWFKNLTQNAPEDFPGWQIRNRAAKTTVSAPKFFAECGA